MSDFIDRFTETVLARIEENRAELAKYVAEGRCVDIDDYRRRTGTISGLAQACELIRETRKELAGD